MTQKTQGQSILIKATANSTFDILLKKAEVDGRVGGKHRCEVCGMLHHSEPLARVCCEMLRARKK